MLGLVLLFSQFASCSDSADTPLPDGGTQDGVQGNENDTPSEEGDDTPKTYNRFVPATEDDPDEALGKNPYYPPEGEPIDPYSIPYHVAFRSTEEIKRFILETPLDFREGVYWDFLTTTRRDGYFLVPYLDGKCLLDNDGQYVFSSDNGGYGLRHGYRSELPSGRWLGTFGYSISLKNAENPKELITIDVFYLKQRYIDYAREAPLLYPYGSPVSSEESDEEIIASSTNFFSTFEKVVEGRNTVIAKHFIHESSSQVWYVCDAGFMVHMFAYGSKTIDSLDIAQRLAFVKVPLTE